MILKTVSLILCIMLGVSITAYAEESSDSETLLIGYWQNFRNTATPALRLSEIPDDYSIVNIAFASVNPNGNVKFTLQGPPYKTMANGVALFKDDIKNLQNRGIRVILSLGGMSSFFHVDNDRKANDFVLSLEKIITEYGFDGVDFDFEGAFSKAAKSYLLEVTRKISTDFEDKGAPILFTIAPEAVDVHWQSAEGKYDRLINSGLIDYVSVQLYNSGCKRSFKPASPCYAPGSQDFIVSQADSTIQTWIKRGVKKAESLYVIGLPATKRAANKGYADSATVKKALSCLQTGTDCASYKPTTTYPKIGGIMTWSINWDAKDDYSFSDSLLE